MRARHLAWSPDETLLAAGFEDGHVGVYGAQPRDGSPGADMGIVDHHRSDILLLEWTPDGYLVSVSVDGDWCVAASGGVVVASGSVGRELRYASLSPCGRGLFLNLIDTMYVPESTPPGPPGPGVRVRKWRPTGELGYTQRSIGWCVHVDLESGNVSRLEMSKGMFISSRVFSVDRHCALYEFAGYRAESPTGFEHIDFRTGVRSRVAFESRSASSHARHLVEIDPRLQRGVRPHYGPVEPFESERGRQFPLLFDLFDAETLETVQVLHLGDVRLHGGPDAAMDTAEPGSEAYMKALDFHLEMPAAVRFDRSGQHLWVLFRGGSVRAVPLSGDRPGMILRHGGQPGRVRGRSVDDAFSPDGPANSSTLAVSPLGTWVGFSSPNEFVRTDGARASVPIDTPVRPRPMRAKSTPLQERPVLQKLLKDGELLAVVTDSADLILVHVDTGRVEPVTRLPSSNSDTTDVELSPDGRTLSIASNGGMAQLVDRGTGALTATAVPGHTMRTWFVDDRTIAWLCWTGTVAVWERDANVLLASCAPMWGAPGHNVRWDLSSTEERPQHHEVFMGGNNRAREGALARAPDRTWFLVPREDGDLDAFGYEDGTLRRVNAYDSSYHEYQVGLHVFSSITTNGEWVASPSAPDEIIVQDVSGPRLEVISCEHIVLAAFHWRGRLAWFENRSSTLWALEPFSGEKPQRVYRRRGAAIRDLSASGDRISFVEYDGTIRIVDLGTRGERPLRIVARADGTRELQLR